MTREAKLAEAATDLLQAPERIPHPMRMILNAAEGQFRNTQALYEYLQRAAEAIGPMPPAATAGLMALFWKGQGPR